MTDIAGRPTDAQIEAFRSAELASPLDGLMFENMPEGWSRDGVCMPGEVFDSFGGKTLADRMDVKHGGRDNWGLMDRDDQLLDIIARAEHDVVDQAERPTVGTLAVAEVAIVGHVEQAGK